MNLFTIFATLCFVASLQHTEGHKPDLCEFMNQYCSADQQTNSQQIQVVEGRRGKAGPRGPPGVFNYSHVDQNIQERYEEFEARINRKTDRKMKVNNERLERKITELEARLEKALNSNPAASGCETAGKIYSIKTENSQDGIQVYCDLTSDGGGWTVFQRRMDGSVDFYNSAWDEYVNGFGEKDKEFWLGLETIYQLTKHGSYELRVDIGDWEGNTAYAQYGTFSIAGSDDNYRLTVGDYSGNAGDSLGYLNGREFTTKDRDNDRYRINCAVQFKGAWWYHSCAFSNLNGVYHVGRTGANARNIYWRHWRNTSTYSYKFTEMKFRKKQN